MRVQRRGASRVRFEDGFRACLIAIDAGWERDCYVEDVSQTGAKISVVGTTEGLGTYPGRAALRTLIVRRFTKRAGLRAPDQECAALLRISGR